MRPTLMIAFCLSLISSAFALEPSKPAAQPKASPNPREIVQDAADAIKKINVVAYDLEYKTGGFFVGFFPNVTGRVVIGKESPDGAKRFRVNVKVQKGESAEVEDVKAGADGKTYYLIDDKNKTVYADIDPQVLGKHRDGIEFTITREFGMARPFEDALKGGEIKYVREDKVDGHDCDVVNFKSTLSTPAMDWYFSKTDHLPRRVRFVMPGPDGTEGGSGEATILSLMVDPKITNDPFALTIPPGYKRTDAFAP